MTIDLMLYRWRFMYRNKRKPFFSYTLRNFHIDYFFANRGSLSLLLSMYWLLFLILLFFLSSIFVYEPILIKFSMSANIMKTLIFYKMQYIIYTTLTYIYKVIFKPHYLITTSVGDPHCFLCGSRI